MDCSPAARRRDRARCCSGQRLIEQGDYARAAEKLRTATSLLATNAQAWNYLGIACQHLGERDEAVRAYQRALSLNHDLSEAHYNLGCLWLEQNKLDAARTEFTTFTLRRGNSAEGFLKLATVQARAHDLAAAEKSFNDVLRLSPQNPEALNGLGLLRLQERRPAEAEQCFAAALKQQPDYRPALLNSAIVAHEYLRDLPAALGTLPPIPRPEAVAAQRRRRGSHRPRAGTGTQAAVAPGRAWPKLRRPLPTPFRPSLPQARSSAFFPAPKAEAATNVPKPLPAANPPKPAAPMAASPAQPVQVVKLTPEPTIKPAQELTSRPAPTQHSAAEPLAATSSVPVTAVEPKAPKRGFFDRVNPANVFRSEPKPPPRTTPLPAPKQSAGPVRRRHTPRLRRAAQPLQLPITRRPRAGNRDEAQRFFDQGLEAQRAHRLNDAIQAYREATQQDPSFFEAQFYLAFTATQAGDLATALTRYEYALAIAPNDANARYNFALVLKQANCVPDAVNELERLLATHPNEARAHLALANIYAQQLRQPAVARPHYLKALELDARSPQASDIRNWLRDHPQ